MNGEKTQAFRVWETGQPGFSVFPYGSQSDLASPKLAGREFELAEETNKVTNGSARSNTPGLHFERARRRREERDPFGWIRDHPRGTKAWHRSVLHVEARDRARPSETNFLFPRRGEVKALGREESRDAGYAAPNPARTRRGSVRRDRRSRYVRVLAPVARRNAARFTRSRPVQPRPHPCAPPKAVDKLTNNGARDDDNPTLTSTPVPNLRSRMRVPYELRRLCGRHNLRMVRDRDRPSSANPNSIPARTLFFKGAPAGARS